MSQDASIECMSNKYQHIKDNKQYQQIKKIYYKNDNKFSLVFNGHNTYKYKYCYWLCYKNDDDYANWFINNKYATLKEEILERITLQQFNLLLKSAQNYIDTNYFKLNMVCKTNKYEKRYKINNQQYISVSHIMTILLYCNVPGFRNALLDTYSKINIYETDEELKARHSKFAFIARHLDELIDCFGSNTGEMGSVPNYYYCVNKNIRFDHKIINIMCPSSVTNKFDVAWINCNNNNGAILELNVNRNINYFDCKWVTDVIFENELLFMGNSWEIVTINGLSSDTIINDNIYDSYLTNNVSDISGTESDCIPSVVGKNKRFKYGNHEFDNFSLINQMTQAMTQVVKSEFRSVMAPIHNTLSDMSERINCNAAKLDSIDSKLDTVLAVQDKMQAFMRKLAKGNVNPRKRGIMAMYSPNNAIHEIDWKSVDTTDVYLAMNCIVWSNLLEPKDYPLCLSVRCECCKIFKPSSNKNTLTHPQGKRFLKKDASDPKVVKEVIGWLKYHEKYCYKHSEFYAQFVAILNRKQSTGVLCSRIAWFTITHKLAEKCFEDLCTLLCISGSDVGDWKHGRKQIDNYLDIFYGLHMESVKILFATPEICQNVIWINANIDKASKRTASAEYILGGKVLYGCLKSIVLNLRSREYDGKNVISLKEVATYIKESLESHGIILTDLYKLEPNQTIYALAGLCTDGVYVRGGLLSLLLQIYNNYKKPLTLNMSKGMIERKKIKKCITTLCELEHDFEHRHNLGISDVLEICLYYKLEVQSMKLLITDLRTCKWQNWMKNKSKALILATDITEKKVIRYGVCLSMKVFHEIRFATYQLLPYFTAIRNYPYMILCLIEKKSKHLNVLLSANFIIVKCALYSLFRIIFAIYSQQNQRGDYEGGEVWDNTVAADTKLAIGSKEIENFRNGIDDGNVIVLKTLQHYLPSIRKQRFRKIKLNSVILDDQMVDKEIVYEEQCIPINEEAEQKIRDPTESKLNVTQYDLDLQKLDLLDNKLNIPSLHQSDNNLFCCTGDYSGALDDTITASIVNNDNRLKQVIECLNDCCENQMHVYCLWKEYQMNISVLRDKLLKKEGILCPSCIEYNLCVSKSLYQVSEMITSFRNALFGENGRIPLHKLRKSKYFNFSKCVNLFNLIEFIIKHKNDEDSILNHNNDILAITFKSFHHSAPELFTCCVSLVIKHFKEWKLIIKYHLFDKRGLLNLLLKKNDMSNKSKRKLILSFRSTMSKSRPVQLKTHAYFHVANCAKSMPVTETLVENVVAVSNDIITAKKSSTGSEKGKEKVVLNIHYGKDMKEGEKFIKKGSEIYEKKIGSHVLVDQNAKSKHKVLKRIKNQCQEGPFALPVTFNDSAKI